MMNHVVSGICEAKHRFATTCLVWVFASTYPLLGQDLPVESKAAPDDTHRRFDWLETGRFQWQSSAPVVGVANARLPESPEHPWVSIKDPSIVRDDGRWHLFCSLRKRKSGLGRIRIGYCSFDSWDEASDADWSVLDLTDGYHGAPQVFFFEPHQLWYMIYQAEDASRDLAYGPCYSTNDSINDPSGWSKPRPLYQVVPGQKAGLDFWVICDEKDAYLFFTTLDGRMWRCSTELTHFPDQDWSQPQVVLRGDIFEASHTYRLLGPNQPTYLTLIEAQKGRVGRYFKAYVSGSLDGEWKPLAATFEKPFASPTNVAPPPSAWTDSYSHGELIRAGRNQKLEVDAAALELLFQGASTSEYNAGNYGDITWKLGRLKLLPSE